MTAQPLDTTGDEYRAWQKERRKGIGGSDVAALLGLSKWASPYSVWVEKVHGVTEQFTDAHRARLDAGHDAEHFLSLQFQRHTGMFVGSKQQRLQHPDHEWAFAHCDGLVYDGPGGNDDGLAIGVWDAKTVNDYTPWKTVPESYQCQMQWQMWLTGLDMAWITAGFSGWKAVTYEIERDELDIETITNAARDFWRLNVLTETAPDVDGTDATAQALAQRFPEHDEGEHAPVVEADVIEWQRLTRDGKDIDKATKAVKARIALALGDAETGDVNGKPAVTFRSQTRTTTCEECGHQSTSNPFRVLRAAKKEG